MLYVGAIGVCKQRCSASTMIGPYDRWFVQVLLEGVIRHMRYRVQLQECRMVFDGYAGFVGWRYPPHVL